MGRTRESANLVSDNNIFVDIASDLVGIGTTAPTVELEVSGNAKISGIITATTFSGGLSGGSVSATTGAFSGDVTLTDTDTGSSAGPELLLYRNSASPDDGDYLGQIKFQGESDSGATRNYAKITGKISDASNGDEDGILEFAFLKAGSQNINARWTSTELKLLNGTELSLGDSQKIYLGTSDDLQIYHDGSNSRIHDGGTGVLAISGSEVHVQNSTQGETCAKFKTDAEVELRYDNAIKFVTKSDGIDVTGEVQCDSLDVDGGADISSTLTLHNNLLMQDNDKIKLGAGNDLQIYHNGSHSLINNSTGDLRIESDRIELLNNASNEFLLTADADGAVSLYHDNSKKFETTGGGVTVTGIVTATEFKGKIGFSAINFVLS